MRLYMRLLAFQSASVTDLCETGLDTPFSGPVRLCVSIEAWSTALLARPTATAVCAAGDHTLLVGLDCLCVSRTELSAGAVVYQRCQFCVRDGTGEVRQLHLLLQRPL
jgi:hypothetical protein